MIYRLPDQNSFRFVYDAKQKLWPFNLFVDSRKKNFQDISEWKVCAALSSPLT